MTITVSSDHGSAGYLSVGCLRLVHPSVVDAADRLRQSRLLAVLLAGSLLVAAAYAVMLPGLLGSTGTVSAIWAALGAAWLMALGVAASGEDRHAQVVALALSTMLVGFLVTVSGGLASPASLLLLALPFEAWWVRRSRNAVISGAVCALVASLLPAISNGMVPATSEPAAWHWILPLVYGATVGLRAPTLAGEYLAARKAPIRRPVEELMQAVVFRLGQNGEVTDASAKARSLMGIAPELMLGNGLFDRIHVGDRVAFLCTVSELREGAGTRTAEVRLRLPREADQPAADNYRPFSLECFVDDAGAIVALARPNDDVAALRRKLQSALEAAESTDIAKARFLGAVSHELRTPLNAIIGFSDMLMHEMFGRFQDPRQKEYVGLILESGHHLLSVVNAILDVSKIESGAYHIQPEPFLFAEAVGMCRSMMGLQAAEKSICLEECISPSVGTVHADRRAVQQMLINLVANAIKFTPANGKVTIGANRVGSKVNFWVADTGIGIAADDLKRIGEPFMQLDNDYTRRFEGTGLGLSLVKGLVGLHRGTMSIESAPGEGTVVSISLPTDGPASLDDRADRTPQAMSRVGKTENDHGPLRKAG